MATDSHATVSSEVLHQILVQISPAAPAWTHRHTAHNTQMVQH